MNGRKSYVIPTTAFVNGYIARFPSIIVSTSLSAVMRSEKLIHMGSTKTMTITDLVLSSLIARM